jgi:hypothetical protein
VWNAQLQSAFDEVDRLMQSLYMFSEISPDAFGIFEAGAAASGRALKYRLMRTVAKINRKKLYFDRGLKEVVYLAQLLAAEHGIEALGTKYAGAPEIPSIEWKDPIPQDSYEQAQEEELRLASGNQTVLDSIMNIDGLTEEQAAEKVKAIAKEKKILTPTIAVPVTNVAKSKNGANPDEANPDVAVPGQSPKTTPSGKPALQNPAATNVVIPSTPKPAKADQ